jgi:hypothetical protein
LFASEFSASSRGPPERLGRVIPASRKASRHNFPRALAKETRDVLVSVARNRRPRPKTPVRRPTEMGSCPEVAMGVVLAPAEERGEIDGTPLEALMTIHAGNMAESDPRRPTSWSSNSETCCDRGGNGRLNVKAMTRKNRRLLRMAGLALSSGPDCFGSARPDRQCLWRDLRLARVFDRQPSGP